MATVSMQDRELLHTILKNVNEAQLAAHNSTRTFRNLLAIVALGIAVGAVLFPWIAGRADPSMLSVVGSSAATTSPSPVASGSAPPSSVAATPAATSASSTPPSPAPSPTATDTRSSSPQPTSGSTSSSTTTPADDAGANNASKVSTTLRTLATVELWGMVGGLLGAMSVVLRIRGSTTPIGLQLAQLALKLPAGAWTGLVGVILLQSTLLPSVQPAPTYTLAAYAIVFGAGQQALTRFVDQRASALLDKTKTQGETTVQTA